MATHERVLPTTASPSTVWGIWSDPSTWPRWNPDVRSLTLDGPFATGTTGTMATTTATHRIRLADVTPGQSFTLETSPLLLTRFAFHCSVRPGPSNGSVLTQSLTMTGPLAAIFSPLMGERIANSFLPLLRGLAAAAEAAAP